MSAYSTHCTEQISCVQTQRSFCCAACRRTVPATALRPFAPGTHSTTLSRRVFFFRDALRYTIAPRLFPQGRNQIYYRAASFSSGTHLYFSAHASVRTSSSLHLRPSGIDDFQDFKSNPDSQIYSSDHAPKGSQSISRFAFLRFRSSSHKIFNPKACPSQMISFALYRQAPP